MSNQIRIGDWILDTGTQQLRRGTQVRELTDLCYKALLILIEHAPEIVSHQELITWIWAGRRTSHETLTQRIKLLRDALEDHGPHPVYIAAVRKRGYRLLVHPSIIDQTSIGKVILRWPRRRIAWLALVLLILSMSLLQIPPWSDRPASEVTPRVSVEQMSVGILPFQLTKEDNGQIDVRSLSQTISPTASELIAHLPNSELDANNAYISGRALLYLRNDQSAREAVRQFQKAVAMDPVFSDAWALLGEAWLLNGEYAALPGEDYIEFARAAINRALILNPESSKAFHARSMLANFTGDATAAIRFAQKSIALDPTNPRAYEILGEYHSTFTRDLGLAKLMWRRATELNPESMYANYKLGNVFVKEARLNQALVYLRQAIQLGEQSPPAYVWMSRAYATAGGQLDEAVRWMHRCQEKIPNSRNCLSTLVSSYVDLLDEDATLRWLDVYKFRHPQFAVLKIDPYLICKDFAGAVQAFNALDKVTKLSIDNRIKYRLAVENLGNPELALNYYRRTTPELFEMNNEVLEPRHILLALDIAHLERRYGESHNATRIIKLVVERLKDDEFIKTQSSATIQEIRIITDLLQDKPLQAIARLSEKFNRGNWAGWWRYDLDPLYAPLRKEANYQRMMAKMRAQVAQQRMSIRNEYPLNLAITASR